MCELLFLWVLRWVLVGCQSLGLCWRRGVVRQSTCAVHALTEKATDCVNTLGLQFTVGVIQVTASSGAKALHVMMPTVPGGEAQTTEAVIGVGSGGS